MTTFINTEKSLLDMAWLCARLKAEHWGWCLTDEKIKAIVEHQLCFGLYENVEYSQLVNEIQITVATRRRQIGFCSVLTDSVSVSMLGNVVIDPAHRRKGYGKQLVGTVLRHPDVKHTICWLGTRDATAFYEKFDFGPTPYHCMQKDPI